MLYVIVGIIAFDTVTSAPAKFHTTESIGLLDEIVGVNVNVPASQANVVSTVKSNCKVSTSIESKLILN